MAKQKRRNPYAFDPIMRKGGVHEKSNKAKRSAAKRATEKLVRERRGDASFPSAVLRRFFPRFLATVKTVSVRVPRLHRRIALPQKSVL